MLLGSLEKGHNVTTSWQAGDNILYGPLCAVWHIYGIVKIVDLLYDNG